MCRAALGPVCSDRRVPATDHASGRRGGEKFQETSLHRSHQEPYSAPSRAENTVTGDFRRRWGLVQGGRQESREKPMVTSVLLGVPSAVRDQRAESRSQV